MDKYEFIEGSPVDYEELTMDIVANGKYIVRLQKDEGIEKLKIEFFEHVLKRQPNRVEPMGSTLYLNEFIEALEYAKSLLLR